MDYLISEKAGEVERDGKGTVPTIARMVFTMEGDMPDIGVPDKVSASPIRTGYLTASKAKSDEWRPIGGGAWRALASTLKGAIRSYPRLAVEAIEKLTVDGVEITTTTYALTGDTVDRLPADYLRAFLRRFGRPSYRTAFPKKGRDKVDGCDASAGLSTILLGVDAKTGRAKIDTGLSAQSIGIYLGRHGVRVGSSDDGGKGQRLFTPSPRDTFGVERMAGLSSLLVGAKPAEDWSTAARYEDAIVRAATLRPEVKDASKHDGYAVERVHVATDRQRADVWTFGKAPARLEGSEDKVKAPKVVKAPKRAKRPKAPDSKKDKNKGEKAA